MLWFRGTKTGNQAPWKPPSHPLPLKQTKRSWVDFVDAVEQREVMEGEELTATEHACRSRTFSPFAFSLNPVKAHRPDDHKRICTLCMADEVIESEICAQGCDQMHF
ncbi:MULTISPECIES: hypothetical protein [Burkholderia]|uniref:hypothetical protein n=1 Tax=Burkholderia TaxID=32008 RepID=UPI00126A0D0A|nr:MULTISPECIES: hypothetical protein [Burkholderia]